MVLVWLAVAAGACRHGGEKSENRHIPLLPRFTHAPRTVPWRWRTACGGAVGDSGHFWVAAAVSCFLYLPLSTLSNISFF
jgi:hypothetical protein